MKNSERNPMDKIYIRGNGTTNVYWDDVTISEVSAINPASLSDEEIQEIFKDSTIEYGNPSFVADAVTFKNIKPLQNYVKEYEIYHKLFSHDSSGNEHITENNFNKEGDLKEDGSVKVDLKDNGLGLWMSVGSNLKVWAITNDGRKIEVLNKNA